MNFSREVPFSLRTITNLVLAAFAVVFFHVGYAGAAERTKDNNPQAKIAFLRLTNGYWQLWLMESDGKNQKQLTSTPVDKVNASWGPGNRELMFNTNRGETFILDAQALQLAQVLLTEKTYDAAWSPDGKRVAFGVSPDDLARGKSSLWVIDVDGQNKKKVAGSPVSDAHYAAWYNNGKELVFRQCVMSSNMEVHHDFWVSETTGTQLRPIAGDFETLKFDQTVSAKGTVAYSSVRSGHYEIWIIPVQGGNTIQLTKLKSYAGNPSIAPDNRYIAFDSDVSGQQQIYVVTTEGSEPTQLTHEKAPSRNPVWTN